MLYYDNKSWQAWAQSSRRHAFSAPALTTMATCTSQQSFSCRFNSFILLSCSVPGVRQWGTPESILNITMINGLASSRDQGSVFDSLRRQKNQESTNKQQYTGNCHPASDSVDTAGWQVKIASIELWIQWCNAHCPRCRSSTQLCSNSMLRKPQRAAFSRPLDHECIGGWQRHSKWTSRYNKPKRPIPVGINMIIFLFHLSAILAGTCHCAHMATSLICPPCVEFIISSFESHYFTSRKAAETLADLCR